MIPFAHAGHWLPQLLYLAPVVALAVAFGLGRLEERRGANADTPAPAPVSETTNRRDGA
jgi:hypothetical protein